MGFKVRSFWNVLGVPGPRFEVFWGFLGVSGVFGVLRGVLGALGCSGVLWGWFWFGLGVAGGRFGVGLALFVGGLRPAAGPGEARKCHSSASLVVKVLVSRSPVGSCRGSIPSGVAFKARLLCYLGIS